jgi:hypothetical protein
MSNHNALKDEVAKLAAKVAEAGDDTDLDELEAQADDLRKRVDAEHDVNAFESAAAEIRKRENCTRTVALQKARQADPELFQRYQANTVSSRPVLKSARSRDAQQFDLIVDGYVIRDRVKRTEAMRRARREHPIAFENSQARR